MTTDFDRQISASVTSLISRQQQLNGANWTACSSTCHPFGVPPKTFTPLDALPTEALRTAAIATDGGRANWSQWTREMLIAFFRNRRIEGWTV